MELRLYTFVNFYLSSIQQGIQSLHVLGDMMVKYVNNQGKHSQAYETMMDWASSHKTSIVLNGGIHSQISSDYETLLPICEKLGFPIAKFHEDDQSLGGIMTSFGIVLPQNIYDAKYNKDFNRYEFIVNECDENGNVIKTVDFVDYKSHSPEFQLLEILKSKSLAK